MGFDGVVHAGLRHRRLIRLVMTAASVADEVDNYVLVELIAVVHGQLCHEHYRLGVIAIDVEYGSLNHLGNVGAVLCGARVGRLTGGKADLIVQYDVQGPACAVSPRLGHLEGFHDDTLTRKGRIAMKHDGNHRLPIGVIATVLPCANRSFNNRRHDLQMGGVEGQRQVHLATRRHHVR